MEFVRLIENWLDRFHIIDLFESVEFTSMDMMAIVEFTIMDRLDGFAAIPKYFCNRKNCILNDWIAWPQ